MRDLDFLEIGTSDFDTCIEHASDTTKGISVEPIKFYIDRLPNPKNVKKVNAAISPTNSEKDSFMYYIPHETIIERLNTIENKLIMNKADMEMNTEFRIKWPRGELGALPADSEQFMLIEHLAGELEKLSANIESGQAPYDQQQQLTLDFYKGRIEKIEDEIKAIRKDMMGMIHDGMKKGSH